MLRFMVGLGVGGMWPNGVALVAECWPNASRPTVSGILGAGINVGILGLSLLGRHVPDHARLVAVDFHTRRVLGRARVLVVLLLPESPKWLASRGQAKKPSVPLRDLFRGNWLWPTLIGILLCSVPLIGAWAGSKWMIPWADSRWHDASRLQVDDAVLVGSGATIGGFWERRLSPRLGRRAFLFLDQPWRNGDDLGHVPLDRAVWPNFLPIVFAQGLVATLFFGWLPLYLPELFPVRIRATGAGVAMNIGRFVTAGGVLAAGSLVAFSTATFPPWARRVR